MSDQGLAEDRFYAGDLRGFGFIGGLAGGRFYRRFCVLLFSHTKSSTYVLVHKNVDY